MVKKKAKSTKSSKRRGSWQMEDVQVHTGLPPQVDGQLRCFCRLTIDQVHWYSPSPPDVTHVRVKWWGEDGDGAIFSPESKKANKTPSKITARYPVRSGPRQFASYLNDMGSMVLEVLSGPMMVPIGHAEIMQIGLLSNIRPIDGLYPVFSPREEKIAEIHVSLVLESLMASYDSTGSIPTTDVSMETQATQESMYPQRVQPIPHSQAPQKPSDDPFISPASHQNGLPNGYSGRAEDLRKQLNYSLQENEERQLPAIQSGSTVAITTNGDVVTTNLNQNIPPMTNGHVQPLPQENHVTTSQSDLLSVLLDRGNKLRERMIISSVEEAQTSVKQAFPSDVDGDINASYSGKSERRSSAGSLLKEILKAERGTKVANEVTETGQDPVDLVFGNELTDDLQVLKMMGGSPNSSVSQDLDLMSDVGDPLHSESILQELFYKNPDSEMSGLSELSGDENHVPFKQHNDSAHSTLEDPANARPPSRRSSVSSLTMEFPDPPPSGNTEEKLKKKVKKRENDMKVPKRKSRVKVKGKGSKRRKRSRSSASEASDSELLSTPRSETSQVSFDMPASDLDEPEEDTGKSQRKQRADGLSVERLTLLGRVHVARVTIDTFHLTGSLDLNSSLSKKKGKVKNVGKPPKPSPKAKKSVTYFIEYQFPVVATSRDKYSPNAMATEVMRVASKNVKDGVVNFSHRSVFPIMFDGSAVEKWWKSALIFKLYSRTAGQKVPTLVGSCGIPLKSILKSDNLQIGKDLEIRESGRNSSMNSSLRSGLDYGTLKVSIELASDSKDFSSALARAKLAEMSGKAKFVPIPQTVPPPPPPPVQVDRPPLPPDPQISAQNTQLSSLVLPQQTSHRSIEMQTASLGNTEGHGQGSQLNPSHLSMPFNPGMPRSLDQHPVSVQDNTEAMTLHTLLFIPEGHNITVQGIPSLMAVKRHPVFPPQPHSLSSPGIKPRDMSTRNTYLVCRMFWCNDAVHSNVCWGTFEPQFGFVQVAPVLLSTSLLERMRNNFMVVEVWDKKTSAENDQLIGIVKLSLHQFFMSFRDKKISSALLKSQYPVISVDNYLPVVDPLSGSQFGQIKVLLAMGSAEQVSELQRLKLDGPVQRPPERPQHYLEREDMVRQGSSAPLYNQMLPDNSVEHIFEVVIEGIRGLSLFDNMMWGEADCFIQYHFPVQTITDHPGAPAVKNDTPSMKSFRTATTLCIPDPTFNDITRHRIVLPQVVPVQRELLTACAGAGGGSGGVPFEVWCRYYHPNIRDQCIAKASLPLAKLCAMVTMQKRGEPSVQSFGLPLRQVAVETEIPDTKSQMKDSGLMDVTIHYKTQTVQNDQNRAANKNQSGAQICISVGVIRASGLKAAAEAIARLDSGMQYPAEVGVNTYIKIKLSFLSKEDERVTRTIARTFAPEFSHHVDFPCPLLWTEADNDALALAEILETAEITLEMWHQVPGLSSDLDRQIAQQTNAEIRSRRLVEKTQDVLLGTTTVSLAALLTKRTGINGWFPINLPLTGWRKDSSQMEGEEDNGPVPCNQGLERVGGGVELSIKFAHHNDRDRVVHAARSVGWSPVDLDVEDEEDWQSDDEGCSRYQQITVYMDQVSFPLQNALIAGQTNLDKSARCYVRYKLYDKSAVVSKSVKCHILDTGYILSHCDHKHEFQIPISSPFKWYLREEKLEVQIWVCYGRKEGKQKPQHRDKLIGTTYIDLDTLNDERKKQHRISGMYPLFKPGAASLGGAFLRAHITAKPQFGNVEKRSDDEVDKLSDDEVDEEYDPNDSFHQLMAKKKSKSSPEAPRLERVEEDSVVPSFPVVVSVERAMHLPLISDKNRSDEYQPNTYVSYQTSDSAVPAYTQVFYNSNNPVWDDQQETSLSTELLYQENKNLVFKVWHKPHSASKDPDKSSDRVLGFVSVDLTPLASGLQQICGWYNVMDFNGQCRGQIKVNIVPQDDVTRYIHGIQESTTAVSSSFFHQPSSLPFAVNSSTHNAPPLVSDQPMSLPTDLRPFSSNLPNFEQHCDRVRQHHEMLQQQLSENIRQFLRNHEMSSQESSEESPRPEVSPHWQPPSLQDIRVDDSAACSRSIMFSSLRKQMQDLDDVTNMLKKKLVSPSPSVPTSIQQTQSEFSALQSDNVVPVGSIVSPLSTLRLTSTLKGNENELLLTGSNEGESSRTAVDSGAFSVTQSSEKYQDALDSQRSIDKMDTFRMENTPRDFECIAQQGATPREAQKSSGSTPRDVHNFSDTGIHMGYTPRDDISVSTGGFNTGNTPRDFVNVGVTTPREPLRSFDSNFNARDMQVSGGSSVSNPSSLGFVYQGETSLTNSVNGGYKNGNGSLHRNVNSVKGEGDVKEMSIIQEYTENEEEGAGSDDEGEGDEKYYHEYRDILDEQENEGETDEENEQENVVVPRTLNDVSGKFGGIPGHSVYMENNEYGSPREFVRNGQTMPFDIRASDSRELSRTKLGHHRLQTEDVLDLSDSESIPDTKHSSHTNINEQQSFIEKDSWFSDGEKDNRDEETSHQRTKNHIIGDIDENHLPSEDKVDVGQTNLLQDVELESINSGSYNTQNLSSGKSSRVSSAGSDRHSKKNFSDHSRISEQLEHNEDEIHITSSVPKSPKEAFSEVVTELEDFFTHPPRPQRSRSSSGGSRSRSCSPEFQNKKVQFESRSPRKSSIEHRAAGNNRVVNGDVCELTNGYPEPSSMPNFFLPSEHLEESMKALQKATSGFPSSSQTQTIDPVRQAAKVQATSDLMEKLTINNHKAKFSSVQTKGRQPPTAAETKRIAKIFSEKFS